MFPIVKYLRQLPHFCEKHTSSLRVKQSSKVLVGEIIEPIITFGAFDDTVEPPQQKRDVESQEHLAR